MKSILWALVLALSGCGTADELQKSCETSARFVSKRIFGDYETLVYRGSFCLRLNAYPGPATVRIELADPPSGEKTFLPITSSEGQSAWKLELPSDEADFTFMLTRPSDASAIPAAVLVELFVLEDNR